MHSATPTHIHAVSIVRIFSTKSLSKSDGGSCELIGAGFGAWRLALTRGAEDARARFGARPLAPNPCAECDKGLDGVWESGTLTGLKLSK